MFVHNALWLSFADSKNSLSITDSIHMMRFSYFAILLFMAFIVCQPTAAFVFLNCVGPTFSIDPGDYEFFRCEPFQSPITTIVFSMPQNTAAHVSVRNCVIQAGPGSSLKIQFPVAGVAATLGPIDFSITNVVFGQDAVLIVSGCLPPRSSLHVTNNSFFMTQINSETAFFIPPIVAILIVAAFEVLTSGTVVSITENTVIADLKDKLNFAAIYVSGSSAYIDGGSSLILSGNTIRDSYLMNPAHVVNFNVYNTVSNSITVSNDSQLALDRNVLENCKTSMAAHAVTISVSSQEGSSSLVLANNSTLSASGNLFSKCNLSFTACPGCTDVTSLVELSVSGGGGGSIAIVALINKSTILFNSNKMEDTTLYGPGNNGITVDIRSQSGNSSFALSLASRVEMVYNSVARCMNPISNSVSLTSLSITGGAGHSLSNLLLTDHSSFTMSNNSISDSRLATVLLSILSIANSDMGMSCVSLSEQSSLAICENSITSSRLQTAKVVYFRLRSTRSTSSILLDTSLLNISSNEIQNSLLSTFDIYAVHVDVVIQGTGNLSLVVSDSSAFTANHNSFTNVSLHYTVYVVRTSYISAGRVECIVRNSSFITTNFNRISNVSATTTFIAHNYYMTQNFAGGVAVSIAHNSAFEMNGNRIVDSTLGAVTVVTLWVDGIDTTSDVVLSLIAHSFLRLSGNGLVGGQGSGMCLVSFVGNTITGGNATLLLNNSQIETHNNFINGSASRTRYIAFEAVGNWQLLLTNRSAVSVSNNSIMKPSSVRGSTIAVANFGGSGTSAEAASIKCIHSEVRIVNNTITPMNFNTMESGYTTEATANVVILFGASYTFSNNSQFMVSDNRYIGSDDIAILFSLDTPTCGLTINDSVLRIANNVLQSTGGIRLVSAQGSFIGNGSSSILIAGNTLFSSNNSNILCSAILISVVISVSILNITNNTALVSCNAFADINRGSVAHTLSISSNTLTFAPNVFGSDIAFFAATVNLDLGTTSVHIEDNGIMLPPLFPQTSSNHFWLFIVTGFSRPIGALYACGNTLAGIPIREPGAYFAFVVSTNVCFADQNIATLSRTQMQSDTQVESISLTARPSMSSTLRTLSTSLRIPSQSLEANGMSLTSPISRGSAIRTRSSIFSRTRTSGARGQQPAVTISRALHYTQTRQIPPTTYADSKLVYVPSPAVKNTAVATGTFSVTVGAVAVPVAAMQQGVALALLRIAQCVDALNGEPLDVAVHPLQFGLGDGDATYARGALVGNLLILPIAWGLLSYLVIPMAVSTVSGRSLLASRDFVGWPGNLVMPFAVLSEGSAMASAGLVRGSIGDVFLGLVGIAILLLVTSLWAVELWRMTRLVSYVRVPNAKGIAIVVQPRYEWEVATASSEVTLDELGDELSPPKLDMAYLERRLQLVGSSWWLWSALAAHMLSAAVGVAESLPVSSSVCRVRWAVASISAVLQATAVLTNTVPIEFFLLGLLGVLSCILVVLVALSTFNVGSSEATVRALNAVSLVSSVLGIALIVIGAGTATYEIMSQRSQRQRRKAKRVSTRREDALPEMSVPLVPLSSPFTPRDESLLVSTVEIPDRNPKTFEELPPSSIPAVSSERARVSVGPPTSAFHDDVNILRAASKIAETSTTATSNAINHTGGTSIPQGRYGNMPAQWAAILNDADLATEMAIAQTSNRRK